MMRRPSIVAFSGLIAVGMAALAMVTGGSAVGQRPAAPGFSQPEAKPAIKAESGQVSPGPQVNKEQIEAALKLTQSESAKYEFQLQGSEARPKLVKDPVLRWSNPAAGEIHGNVYLWTVNDRPAVVGSLFKWFSPHTHMSHEFHALAEAPLKARYGERQVWTTRAGGVTFAALDGAPKPAAAAPQRLLQMRRLAKDFVATKKDRAGSQQELRLLPQPIYRYAAAKDQVHDGGLFTFVQGTDPELFLLLEARGKDDAVRWEFAAARMNSVGFHLRYQDREVWAVEIMPWRDVGGHAETYTSFMHKQP